MKQIEKINEDEMILAFLKGEIDSERFGIHIISHLNTLGRDRKIIDNPDLTNSQENEHRRKLLDYRGYESRTALFNNFPTDVQWFRYLLKKEDLKKLKYINYNYWNELSGSSRLLVDGVENVRKGVMIFGESNDKFWKAAEEVKKRKIFPEPILVGTNVDDLRILEGHLRLTSYLLAEAYMPKELTAIVGLSGRFVSWGLF